MSGTSGGLFWFRLNEFLSLTKFGSIAIGILGFFIMKENGYWKEIIFKKGIQWAAIFIAIITRAFPLYIPYVHFEVTAFAYMVIVANVSMNSNTVFEIRKPFIKLAGRSISYGIYMYHWVVIPILIYLVKYVGLWDVFIDSWQIPLLLLSTIVVIVVSHFSYFFFEMKVMKMGNRFLGQKPGM